MAHLLPCTKAYNCLLPPHAQLLGERGLSGSLEGVLAVLATIPLNLHKIKQHQHFVYRGLACGLAQYAATGRDLATVRISFIEHFKLFSYSHFAPALDMMVLLLIFVQSSALSASDKRAMSLAPWIVALSWLFAPALYNPHAFSMRELILDWQCWHKWLRSSDYDEWWFGESADGSRRNLKANNWFCSLGTGPTASRLLLALARVVFWSALSMRLLWMALPSTITEDGTMPPNQGELLLFVDSKVLLAQLAFFLPTIACFVAATRVDPQTLKVLIAFLLAAAVIGAFVKGGLLQGTLALYPLGKALQALLEVALLITPPHAHRVSPTSDRCVSSREQMPSPRHSVLLTLSITRQVAVFHAWLQGLIYFALSFCVATFAVLPLAFVGGLLTTWSLLSLCGGLLTGMSAHQVFLLLAAFCLPLWTTFAFFDGHFVPKRISHHSLLKHMLAFNVGSLHEWYITNKRVARGRIMRVIADSATADAIVDP